MYIEVGLFIKQHFDYTGVARLTGQVEGGVPVDLVLFVDPCPHSDQ